MEEPIADYLHLYNAWESFRTGKVHSRAVDEFAYHVEQNVQELTTQISTKTYMHGSYKRVVVEDKKRRDLAVAEVPDRVVHRYVYDQLVDIFDTSLDPDVWSCRKGKGLHKSLTRAQRLLTKYPHSYIWRADITKFFDYVDHATLKSCLLKKLDKNSILFWLCDQIINSYSISVSQSVS